MAKRRETLAQLRVRLNLPNLMESSEDFGYYSPNGYICEGDSYCAECAESFDDFGDSAESDDPYSGFLGEQTYSDVPMTCGHCGATIPTGLTQDGYEYVKQTDGRTHFGKLMRSMFAWVWR